VSAPTRTSFSSATSATSPFIKSATEYPTFRVRNKKSLYYSYKKHRSLLATEIQWKPFNVITLKQWETDNINWSKSRTHWKCLIDSYFGDWSIWVMLITLT
jgi:hypothetical protein